MLVYLGYSCVYNCVRTNARLSVFCWYLALNHSRGERDALQVLNWISCRISGTSLKCMWASLNDALIFALQRHSAYVCVCVCVCVCRSQWFGCFLPSISASRLVAHSRYVCLISGSNCLVGFGWRTSSESVHIMTGSGFHSKPPFIFNKQCQMFVFDLRWLSAALKVA